MSAGRPTKYTPEVLEAARSYLANYETLGDVVPTVEGMACELGLHKSTLYAWAESGDKPEFSDVFTRVLQTQGRKLIAGGLAGGFNPAVTKMLLTKHGYADRVEQDHTSSDRSMTPPTAIQLIGPNGHSTSPASPEAD